MIKPYCKSHSKEVADFLDDVVYEITTALERKFSGYEFDAPSLIYFRDHSSADITRISFRTKESQWIKLCNVWVSRYPPTGLVDREYWVYFCTEDFFFVKKNTCDCPFRLKQHIVERVVGETELATLHQLLQIAIPATK
jgi:hypothetical protein